MFVLSYYTPPFNITDVTAVTDTVTNNQLIRSLIPHSLSRIGWRFIQYSVFRALRLVTEVPSHMGASAGDKVWYHRNYIPCYPTLALFGT